jgi:ATP-dependent Clp protease adaptor protein ClpS
MSNNTNVIEKVEQNIQLKEPKMYKVLLHNDDTTTMDFVITVLTQIFHKTVQEAVEVTLAIHYKGQGIAGAPYTAEVAEEKTFETLAYARANNFPLAATFEEL